MPDPLSQPLSQPLPPSQPLSPSQALPAWLLTVLLVAGAIATTAAVVLSLVAFRSTNSDLTPRSMRQPAEISSPFPVTSGRTISTEGSAVRRVAPDRASIVLVVNSRAGSASEAQRQNEAAQKAVVASVKSAGVDAGDIHPSGLAISEETRELNDERVIEYVVATEVHIETKDLKNVSKVLQGAFGAGASTGRVEFKTSRLRELRDQARRDAVKAALAKAKDLTEGVDATVGRVLSISEGSFGYWAPSQNMQQNSTRDERFVEPTADSDGGSMEDQFGGGLISVSARVSTTFEMN
jgi:uncharacterized protein